MKIFNVHDDETRTELQTTKNTYNIQNEKSNKQQDRNHYIEKENFQIIIWFLFAIKSLRFPV